MAHPEHVIIVRKGPAAIQQWRRLHPNERLDLSHADITRQRGVFWRELDPSEESHPPTHVKAVASPEEVLGWVLPLVKADLSNADLRFCNLSHCDLSGANLDGVDARCADLTKAVLDNATMHRAKLCDAMLAYTSLRKAGLRKALLWRANLFGAILEGADLRQCDFFGTHLLQVKLDDARMDGASFCTTRIIGVDLSRVNLDKIVHACPSEVSISTLDCSRGVVSDAFLRGCGFQDWQIEGTKLHVPDITVSQFADITYRMQELRLGASTTPSAFFSGFISYSSKDHVFAAKLHDALQARGIRCWLDTHQVLPGDDILDKLNEGIRLWDKVLLLCSEQSLTSHWVRMEIRRAIEKEGRLEKETGYRVLAIVPIDLDGFLFDHARCDFDWAPDMRARHAAVFKGWETDEELFVAQLERVVKAMRADDLARPKPPTPKL